MNLSQMLTIVRRDLHDDDAQNYRWSDDELERHIAHAVSELSEALPREHKATLATSTGSRELDVSSLSDRVMLQAVEYPAGRFPRAYQRFSLWGDNLTLLGDELPDGGDTIIYYGQLHTLDAEGSTIPSVYHDLVATGACGYAAVEWAAFAVNRVNTGGTATPSELLAWGRQRLDYFRQELKRLGRRHRARVNQLYKPACPAASQTTDYGP